MIYLPPTPVRPAVGLAAGLTKLAGKEANMTEIDLVDWTIQEVQHLKTERREPGDVKDNSAVDNLLAVLEPEPMGRTAPEGPVALIAGISPTDEEPVARPSSAIVVDTKPVTGSDLPAVDNLLAVLELEPLGPIAPEGPVALIAGIFPTVEEPVARPSSAISPTPNRSRLIYRPPLRSPPRR
jgi:hypothetical protein